METSTPQLEHLQYAWLVVRKRKWLMIATGLTAFAAVQFFGYLVTPVWEGTTLLLVERTTKLNPSVFRQVDTPVPGNDAGGGAALDVIPILTGWNMAYDVVEQYGLDERRREKRQNPSTLRDFIKNTMVDVVYSPLYLMRGRQDPNWSDKAAEDFIEDWIDVEEEEQGTGVINLTVYGETPPLATEVANGMAVLLEQRTRELSRSKAAVAYGFVARQIQEAEARLAEAEEAVVVFHEERGLHGATESRRLVGERLDHLQADLDSTRRLQGELASEIPAEGIEGGFLQGSTALSPVIRTIEARLVNLSSRRAALLLEKTESHPEVQVLDAEIERNRQQLEEALEAERAMLTAREGELERNIEELDSEMRAMPEKEMELARLQQTLSIKQGVVEELRSRLEQLGMERQSIGNEYTIRVLDRAFVPPGRDQDWPVWWLNVFAGLFFGSVLALGAAFALEYWNQPVLAARDVERLGLRFLGRFPELEERDS